MNSTLSDISGFIDALLDIKNVPDWPNALNGLQLANQGHGHKDRRRRGCGRADAAKGGGGRRRSAAGPSRALLGRAAAADRGRVSARCRWPSARTWRFTARTCRWMCIPRSAITRCWPRRSAWRRPSRSSLRKASSSGSRRRSRCRWTSWSRGWKKPSRGPVKVFRGGPEQVASVGVVTGAPAAEVAQGGGGRRGYVHHRRRAALGGDRRGGAGREPAARRALRDGDLWREGAGRACGREVRSAVAVHRSSRPACETLRPKAGPPFSDAGIFRARPAHVRAGIDRLRAGLERRCGASSWRWRRMRRRGTRRATRSTGRARGNSSRTTTPGRGVRVYELRRALAAQCPGEGGGQRLRAHPRPRADARAPRDGAAPHGPREEHAGFLPARALLRARESWPRRWMWMAATTGAIFARAARIGFLPPRAGPAVADGCPDRDFQGGAPAVAVPRDGAASSSACGPGVSRAKK